MCRHPVDLRWRHGLSTRAGAEDSRLGASGSGADAGTPVDLRQRIVRASIELLEESGVVLSPGAAYGPNGEGFFRISLTVPDERLTEAVERLRSSLGG